MRNFTTAVNGNYSSVIIGARLDFSTYIEASGELPIVAAASQKLLEDLCKKQNMKICYLLEGKLAHVSRNLDLHNSENGLSYSQIWAKADFKNYRDAWADHYCARDKIARKDISTLHADHVLNKKSLTKCPDSWVVLFPVEEESNRRFGSTIESKNSAFEPGWEYLKASGPALFKIYSPSFPTNEIEFNELLKAITGQILDKHLHQLIEDKMRAVLPQWTV